MFASELDVFKANETGFIPACLLTKDASFNVKRASVLHKTLTNCLITLVVRNRNFLVARLSYFPHFVANSTDVHFRTQRLGLVA